MRSLGLMLRLEQFIKRFSGPELRSPECLYSFPVLDWNSEKRTLISSFLHIALSQIKLFLDLLTSGKYRVSSRITEDWALITALPTTRRVSWYAPAFCYSNKYLG